VTTVPQTTGHTPGPWVYEPYESDAYRVKSEDYGGIALLHDPIRHDQGLMDEVEADARLIAAAPDLLERLIVATDWLADKGVPFDHVEMMRIRAAIAKATGEEVGT